MDSPRGPLTPPPRCCRAPAGRALTAHVGRPETRCPMSRPGRHDPTRGALDTARSSATAGDPPMSETPDTTRHGGHVGVRPPYGGDTPDTLASENDGEWTGDDTGGEGWLSADGDPGNLSPPAALAELELLTAAELAAELEREDEPDVHELGVAACSAPTRGPRRPPRPAVACARRGPTHPRRRRAPLARRATGCREGAR